MEERAMQLSETEKRRLQFLIQDRPTQISENSRRYAKAIARKMLDERAAKRKAESLNQAQTPIQKGRQEPEDDG